MLLRVAVLTGLLLCPAAAAHALTVTPIPPGGDGAGSAAPPGFHDRVIAGPPLARAALSSHLYRAPDGRLVEVTLSSSFADTADNRAAAQTYVDFLGRRLHGFELSLLNVFIGTGAQINRICGGARGVLACYSSAQRRMFVPDRDPSSGPFTRAYAVTHEYGHHVAATRSDYPFPAISFGAKYWSSYVHVCSYWRRHQLFPGNQNVHYLQDSGEGFADTFAHMHYPDPPFQFSSLMAPTPGSIAALRRDVLAPWRAQRRFVRRAVLGVTAFRSYPLTVTLDGQLDFRLVGPARANYNILLYLNGRRLAATRLTSSRDHLAYRFCRPVEAAVLHPVVRVVRIRGAGAFTLYVAYPG